MSDSSEAVTEIAKTAGKGIDLASRMGGFIAPLIKGPIEQGMGIFEDKLKYTRWENQVRLMLRAKEFMNEIGLEGVQRAIPLKFAVPLLQGAAMEDDHSLQDMWAKLLVNAIRDDGIELKRVYIDILERLSPLEAKILEKLYSLPFSEYRHRTFITRLLPDDIEALTDFHFEEFLLNSTVELALINLARIGCISPDRTLGGGEVYTTINLTFLGSNFYAACTL